ncbi:MAG TPA: hypothetical protein VMM56_11260 [Planctomycetaceae bacterium]|nr:hypothetical protein [Planctomycetaceae bacterium]
MKSGVSLIVAALFLISLVAAIDASSGRNSSPVAETVLVNTVLDSSKPEPVETDMHEFMEYYFQPTYQRLKVAMAVETKDNNAWKAIKADAMILAEGGNLTLQRTPEEDAEAWNKFSAEIREHGKSLYVAAKKKDAAVAQKSYETMLNRCNACHDKFADGEHQLAP